MKVESFNNVMYAIPNYVAYFEIVKVPDWLARYHVNVEKGDEFYIKNTDHTTAYHLKSGMCFGIGASCFKFLRYAEPPVRA